MLEKTNGRGAKAGRPLRVLVAAMVAGLAAAAGAGAPAFAGTSVAAGTAQAVAPGKPRDVHVLPGIDSLVVSWQAPADAGDGIIGYVGRMFSTNSGTFCSVAATVHTCTVEVDPTLTYTVTVAARGKGQTTSAEVAAPGKYRSVRKVALPVLTTVPKAAGSLGSTAGRKLSAPGTATTISGRGYAARTTVTVTLFSAPKHLATTTTDAEGTFRVRVTLPAGYAGSHTLVAAGLGPTGTVRYLNLPVTLPASGTGSGLPVTGTPVPLLVGLGLLLLACGLLLRLLGRRPAV